MDKVGGRERINMKTWSDSFSQQCIGKTAIVDKENMEGYKNDKPTGDWWVQFPQGAYVCFHSR